MGGLNQLRRSYSMRLSEKLVEKINHRKMLTKSNIVSRLNHLYLIQTWLEIQRHCEKLYSRFKHKLLIFVSNRMIRLNRMRRNRRQQLNSASNNKDYNVTSNYQQQHYWPHLDEEEQQGNNNNNNIFQDLNHFLVEHSATASTGVSIPMQMLLLPFIVSHRPGSENRCMNELRGGETVAIAQQHQFMTLVAPSQPLVAATIQPLVSNHQHHHHQQQQTSQIQFTNDHNHNHRLGATSTWSASVASRARNTEAAKLHCGLTMRNPLIQGLPADRRHM